MEIIYHFVYLKYFYLSNSFLYLFIALLNRLRELSFYFDINPQKFNSEINMKNTLKSTPNQAIYIFF